MSLNRNEVNGQYQLQLDNVLASQPELGPSVPDGGYGWVILLSSIFFYILVPSLTVGFGIIMLFSRLENSASLVQPMLWDNKFVFVPIFYTATTTIADPWLRKFISQSTWPRLVATAGTCLICAGLLIGWKGINGGYHVAPFMLSGIISGIGSTIVLVQSEILISQYFRLKLRAVRIVLQIFVAIGFIVTPIALGHHIIKSGLLHVIIWYQAIILQGTVACMTFKKPKYLKSSRKSYKIIANISDDEEDVFAKKTHKQEVHTANQSSTENHTDAIQTPHSSSSNFMQKKNWETFEDETPKQSKVKVELHQTFASSNSIDNNKTVEIDDDDIIPKPIFDNKYPANDTYTYDAFETIGNGENSNAIFTILSENQQKNWIENLKDPSFFKSLLEIITTKFSTFIFWTLFPSYFYVKVEHLKIHHATYIIGCFIGAATLFFTILSSFINNNNYSHKSLLWWIFSWMGALGYIIISNSDEQAALMFGAISVVLSLSVLKELDVLLFKINVTGHNSWRHTLLSTIAALGFCGFFLLDLSYRSSFYFMALLQFLTGSIWLSNFIYKKIKKINM